MLKKEILEKASRFASVEDVLDPEFQTINNRLDLLNKKFQLSCHEEFNAKLFPWAVNLYAKPQIYAARLWEYPFAILSAELEPGLTCADIGCGMTPFSIFLKEEARCDVTGFDPDFFSGVERNRAFGVSADFLNKTGLKVIQSKMECITAEASSFDRVFCISVIEHVSADVAYKGIQEMARILKPGGLAIITCDVNLFTVMNEANPMSLMWESGLLPRGALQLQWPLKRLGIFFKRNEPADVFGFVLEKPDYEVETAYSGIGGIESAPTMPGYMIPHTRRHMHNKISAPPLSWRQRIKKAIQALIQS